MDLSKLKFGIYDILGIILPGLIFFSEICVLTVGWQPFLHSAVRVTGTTLALLIFLAFALGHIVQESGDAAISWLKGERYFYRGRDDFWASEESAAVRKMVHREYGDDAVTPDGAFNYCVARLKGGFDKRDMFVATSDLCRSMVILCAIGVLPAIRVASGYGSLKNWHTLTLLAAIILVLIAIATLAWRRMVRFRKLSEAPVFWAYMAIPRKHPRVENRG